MNRIKRILSMVLVCAMVLAIVPATTLTAFAAATGTTALFNGNATYLLQERFELPASFTGDGTRVISGWDIDYRGGDVSKSGGALITDSNTFEKVSMSHQLMKHTGAGLIMESVFTFTTVPDEGFYYTMSGDGKTALKVETVRQTAGGKNCLLAVNGTNTSIVPEKDVEYHLRAEFTGSTVTVWINGEKVANAVNYVESTSSIDNIEIGTSETGIGKICIKNVYVYVNYTVNESFLGSDVSDWWDTANGEVVEVPGAPYAADTKGFALNPMEAVEPSYKADAPHVFVQAKTAADYTWTGGGSKVTVTNHDGVIGGRQGVVAAAGVGNANDQTVGVVIDGSNFAFAEDDVITYSYDIYLGSETYARTWIRDMGDFSPYITIESSDHYVNANRWTTITKTLTYADLVAAAADGWTTPGKFVVCIRPGVAQTAYLDNFTVKVTKAGDNYVSNAATGARVSWTNPLEAWDNNIMYGRDVSSLEYVADPAGTKSGKVLKAVVGTAGAYGVVAVKVTDDFGAPIRSLAAGEVLDVSFDFRSSVAQGSSTNGVSLRIGDTSFWNGNNAPTGTAYDMGSLQVAANTWTTIKASYTVTADLTLTSGQTWYIPVRVPTAGTIYMDNFKLSIRDPEKSVIAPTWEINSAADVTYKNGGTATDANGIGGRDNVVMLSNLADANGNTAGIVLGNAFAFKEGDVLKYSFDAYSTASINPNLWLRNHGSSLNPYKQIDIATIPASTWTTRSGEIDYATLLAAGAFNTPDKFALYFRPNKSGTIYIDNFKVEVFNSNEHIVDLVDGARVKFTANSASDLNFANGLASDDATKGAIKMNLNGSGDGTSVGFQFGKNFSLREGDTFTYSYDIYTETTGVYPDFWLRERGNYLAMKTFYHPELATGTWTTVTGTATYDQLIAEDADYATASNNWYAYIRLRNSKSATVWVKNFKVAVTRPEYAFGEPPSNASLEKKFSALSGSQTFEFDVFVPSTGANGFSAKFGGANFKIEGGKFYLGATELHTPTNNVWYNIKIVNDGATASAYVNGTLRGSAAAAGSMTSIAFENTTGKQILVDNIQVAPTVEASDYADYPVLSDSDIATPAGGLSVGMVSYPMWREGIHYGWDLITPYENERTPYLGYYTGGSQEVADWNIKWWAEHGFDHVIYPFVRPDITEAGGQPSFSVRGEELHDGYMNAVYKDKVDFAIMLSNPKASQFESAAEWKANVLPYIVEHYFKNPNYKVLNNQLVVYNYDLDGFAECLTKYDENGNVTQNGTTEVRTILQALESAAEGLGYTGVMFVADQTSIGGEFSLDNFSSGYTQTFYKWRYTWKSDVAQNVIDGITNDYSKYNNVVASIPMGFESTPWVQSDIGFMSPADIESICNTVIDRRTSSDPALVLFTCWDEWGEGHFFSPSSKSGFDYLNAARKVLTNKGAALTTEETPSVDAVKRMGVLYPEGRQILKFRPDQKAAIDASQYKNSIGTITPSRSTFGYAAGTNKDSSWIMVNYTDYTVRDAGQASVTFKSPISDFSQVTAIKVRGYAENSSTLTVNLATGGRDEGYDAVFPADGSFRFSCTNNSSTTSAEYILYPNNPDALANAKNITYVRFNPAAGTSVGSTFKVEEITFYTDKLATESVYVDGEKFEMVSEPIVVGTTRLLPAYRFLIEAGAKVTWDKASKKLYATMNGITAVYQNGMRNVVDATDTSKVLATAAEGAGAQYLDGNLFVDYQAILKPFGYTVQRDATTGDINFSSAASKVTYNATDSSWEFEKAGDTEGWSLSAGSKEPVTYTEGGSAITVRDGAIHYRASHTDTNMVKEFAEGSYMPKQKYFIMHFDPAKTTATQMYVRLYDDANNTPAKNAGGVAWTINLANYPTGEIILDLETTADRNGNMTYSTLSDNITRVRIDAVLNKTGSNYIEDIKFANSLVVDPFQFKAYSFGENVFTDYTAAYWQSSGTTNGTNWGAVNLTDEGDVMIKPSEGQNNGITGITWIKNGTDLGSVVGGKIVRVSFDYKGVGDITSFRFENRDTGGSPGRDGEEFTANVTSEWQHFDAYINVDEVTDSRRWFGIRATRKDSTGDDYLVVRDWQIRVLNEETEVGMFTDSGVAIKLIANEEVANTAKIYAGAYDLDTKELNNFTSGSVPNVVTINTNDTTKTETLDYYYIAPTEATDEIRVYLWDGFNPLTKPFVLEKAN